MLGTIIPRLSLFVLVLACHRSPMALAGDDIEPQVTEGVIRAPVAEVWKVLSTAEGFKKLGVVQCEMDFRVGGLIRTHYSAEGKLGDEGTITNEILAYEPNHMLAIRIKQPPSRFPFAEGTWKETWTVMSIYDKGNGETGLRITGLGYPDTDEGRRMRDFFARGNAWVLQQLQAQYVDNSK